MVSSLTAFQFWWQRKLSFTVAEQIEFMNMFNSFIEEGEGLQVALSSTRQAYSEVYGESYVVVKICDQMLAAVHRGKGLDDLMMEYFSPTIAVGFELSKRVSGDRSNILGITQLVEAESNLVKEAVGQLIMPLMMFVMGVSLNIVMGGIVIPKLEKISKVVVDTPEALLSKGIAGFVMGYWYVLVILLVGIVVGFSYLQKNLRPDDASMGWFRGILDTVWPFSLYKVFWSIRISRLLGYLKLAEVKDSEALLIIKKFGSRFVGYHVDIMLAGIQVGKPKKEYFGKGLFMPTQMIRIRRFFTNADNHSFANALVKMSLQSEKDVKMVNKSIVTKWQMFFMFTGLGLGLFSIGGVIDAAIMGI